MGKAIDLIAAEQERARTEEGYTIEHDRGHAADLALAGGQYAINAEDYIRGWGVDTGLPPGWPWDDEYWKPTGDPVRDLVKAGSLIASAIDSLLEEQQ